MKEISDHYTLGGLIDKVREGLAALGKTTETVTLHDMAPIDEFHIGGRQASEEFLDQLPISRDDHCLDVGCGLGGGARFAAKRYGCRVTGIDLTQEFVETGRELCKWVELDERVELVQGSALSMPFESESFSAAYMMHVGMNIPDKDQLFREVARVLKPGSRFGVYDVMQTSDETISFPVPWAEEPGTSALASPDTYRDALEQAGFTIRAERSRRAYALDFFDELRVKANVAGGPPPLGLHILMGESRAEKVKNMVANISSGRIAPVEMICTLE
jgi:ubiquinone/menaquinone biosynthesis C-methylase UbiE